MLTLKSVSIVMTTRKMAVTRSSSVKTQVGGGGIACGAEDVELLSFVTLFAVGVPRPLKAGGDRDTSSGLGRCARGKMIAEVWRRGIGTQQVNAVGFVTVVGDWMVGGENAIAASKAVRRGRSLISGGGQNWKWTLLAASESETGAVCDMTRCQNEGERESLY